MSINRSTDKENMVHLHKRILLNHQKEWNNVFYSNMNGPGDYTKESKRKTNIIWYHFYVETKKKWYNELFYKTEVELHM